MEDDFSEEEALQSAKEDWDDDSKGAEAMTRSDFLDSLFELADMWTESIDAAECARQRPEPS